MPIRMMMSVVCTVDSSGSVVVHVVDDVEILSVFSMRCVLSYPSYQSDLFWPNPYTLHTKDIKVVK